MLEVRTTAVVPASIDVPDSRGAGAVRLALYYLAGMLSGSETPSRGTITLGLPRQPPWCWASLRLCGMKLHTVICKHLYNYREILSLSTNTVIISTALCNFKIHLYDFHSNKGSLQLYDDDFTSGIVLLIGFQIRDF